MSNPSILTIPILPFGMVHCHLVMGKTGCILVDTGTPGSEEKIKHALKKHGLSFRDIDLIVITHAHADHAGSAARIRELSDAPVLAHAGDLDYYERRKEMTYCIAHWWGPLFLRSGLPGEAYLPFTPDILLSDNASFGLKDYGIDGFVRHTPGHTAGSVSVELGSGDALVGDLVASGILLGGIIRKNHAIRPPFEDDPQAVSVELMNLVNAGMQRFYMGHGGPLAAEEVRRHANSLRFLESGHRYAMEKTGCTCTKGKLKRLDK